MRSPRVVDLFAGAGLFSSAFQREGFEVVFAIELDPFAAQTYAANVGGHVIQGDISQQRPVGPCDVLLAAPPCQGFSTLGKRDPDDPRNLLSLEVLRWAKALNPRVIVIENVAAFVESPIWRRVTRGLQRQGYEVGHQICNAYDFGVAQNRLRSFTFASLQGVPVVTPPRHKRLTVRDALKGLSSVPDGRNQHVAPEPSGIALARMKVIPPGGGKREIMARAPHLAAPSWIRVKGEVMDAWGRMEWDRPCNTLRTCLQNASKGRYIHPDQHRVISLREAARLHSIPDSWRFVGPNRRIARQIGNSVPPSLGRAIARSVARVL